MTVLKTRSGLPSSPFSVQLPVLGELERNDLGQGAVGDHDRGRVDRVVADDVLEALGDVDDLLCLRVGLVGLAQLGPGGEAVREARAAPHDRLGDELREAVAGRIVEAEHPGGVARRGARLHLAEGDDLRDRVRAVLLLHVADHALAAPDREVDVDVRHRLALGVQEALEHQVRGDRVDVGDPQRVAHDRSRRGAAARPDRDAVRVGELHEVPDDQEVGLETHLLDHLQLPLEALDGLGGRRVAVASLQPLLGEPAEVRVRLAVVGGRVARQQHLAERHLDLAALGDLERGRNGLGPGAEGLRQLVGGLQVELVRVEAQLRLSEGRLRLHAQERGVARVVLAAQVVDVGGADDRPPDLARDPRDPLVRAVLLGNLVVLELEVDVVGTERPHQVFDVGARVRRALLHEPLAEPRLQAAGERDQALGVRVDQLHVDVRLSAPEALQVAGRRELDQIAQPRLVASQQRQVIALVLDLLTLAPVVDQVGLEPDDRLHGVLAAGLVELDRAVQDAVVGEPERRHPELGCPRRERLDLAGAVEQRILGMDVEVNGLGRTHGEPV